MRIAILAPEFIPTWGGVGIYTVELVRELSKHKDLELHVITPKRGKDYSTQKIIAEIGNPANVKIHNVSTANDTFFYNFKFQVGLARKFKTLHRKYKFDLVHSMNLVHMPDIYLDFNKMGLPHLCTVHTTIKGQVQGFLKGNKNFLKMAPSEKMSLLLYPLIKTLERIYMSKYSHFITVSNKFVDIIQEEYDLTGKTIVPIHNGINLENLNYKQITTAEAYKRFPMLKEKKNKVLFAGRIITQKGIHDFIKAVSKIDCHPVIAGRGDERLLHKLIREHKLKNYTYLGFVPNKDLKYLLRISDIFVLPSYYENFPISLLEAMAMKVPCIATDVGAVSEIITHGKTGILVKKHNLATSIRSMLNKPSKKLAQAGYEKVTGNLTSKKMADKTKRVYEVLA